MANPMIRIHDTETDEIIDREMTDAEFKFYQEEAKSYEALIDKQEKAANDKIAAQAKLEALGLSAQDLKALGL